MLAGRLTPKAWVKVFREKTSPLPPPAATIRKVQQHPPLAVIRILQAVRNPHPRTYYTPSTLQSLTNPTK